MKLKGLGLAALWLLAYTPSVTAHCGYGEVWCDGRCVSTADGSQCCTNVCGQKQKATQDRMKLTEWLEGTICCGAKCCPGGSPDSSSVTVSASWSSSGEAPSDTSSHVDVSQESSTMYPTGDTSETTAVGSQTSAEDSTNTASVSYTDSTPGTWESIPSGYSTNTSGQGSTNTPGGSATDTASGSSGTPGTPGGSGTSTNGDVGESTATGSGSSTETNSGDSTNTTPGGPGETNTESGGANTQSGATNTASGGTSGTQSDATNTEGGATNTPGGSTDTGPGATETPGGSTATGTGAGNTSTGDSTNTESGATNTQSDVETSHTGESTNTASGSVSTATGDATNTETGATNTNTDATNTPSGGAGGTQSGATSAETGATDTASGTSTEGSGETTNTSAGGSTNTASGSSTETTEGGSPGNTNSGSTDTTADDSTNTASGSSTETTDGSGAGTTDSGSTGTTTGESATETGTNGNGGSTNTGTNSGGGPSSTAFTSVSTGGSATTGVTTSATPTDIFVWTRSDGIEVTFTSTWAIIGTDTIDLPSVTETTTITTDGVELTLFPSPTAVPTSSAGDDDDDDDDDDLIPCIIPPIPICIPCLVGFCFPPIISTPPPIPPPGGGDDGDDNTTTSGCRTVTATDLIVSCSSVDGTSLSCTTQPAATVVECSAEPFTSTTIAGCPMPTASEEDGMNYGGCDPNDPVGCEDESCNGRIAPSPFPTVGPICFGGGRYGCQCVPSDDTPRICPQVSNLPCDADCDAENTTCRGKWEGCACGGQATSTATSSEPPSTTSKPPCPTSQSCDDCNGAVNDGQATCQGGDFDSCQCTPNANTPGFDCGEQKSCELNDCDGTWNDGQATCTNAFRGCQCLPSTDTPGFECGEPQSCQSNGCNGRANGAGEATCQDAFKGCSCLPDTSTPGFCGVLGPCSFSGCQGIAVDGQQLGVCQADAHKGCSCTLPTQPTTTSVAEPDPPVQTGDPWMLRLWGDQQCTLGTIPFLQQTGRGPSTCQQTFGTLRSWCAPTGEWPDSLMVYFYDTDDCTGFRLSLDKTGVGCPGESLGGPFCTENDNMRSWQVVNYDRE
ncbi:hypothetical protein EDB81DRAFT_756316 [Dactylonectria macrodidyma]|uniref:Uncharacterized protein n=1 Tax=Dactylonectria macrodidyma TaxID=307937 RepID=A0A9P9FGG9_9HYPO|nr:hypothetical protein EDB81DRAFT_756316 [Dactylonectria macrodidyma]